jgi:small subunit ribosomal protein S1
LKDVTELTVNHQEVPTQPTQPTQPAGGQGPAAAPPTGPEAVPPPAIPVGTKVPILSRRGPVDADIERELEAALAGMDEAALRGLTQEPRRAAKGAAPADSGRKKGRVLSVHGDDVFMDVGGRSQGVVSIDQFPEGPPAVGQEFDVSIEGYDRANGLLLLTRKGAAVRVDWSTVQEGLTVEARVTGVNKGGLEVDVNGIRGFIPISQLELYRVEDAAPYLGQRLKCLVTEAKPEERNLVLSRRAVLEREREEAREKTWAGLAEGQVRTGIVRSVKDFGAFVDLGGVDGLLHVGDMSWSRVASAADVVQPGQSVEVVVLKINPETRKLSLGLKQLQKSPWDEAAANYPPDTVVAGKVTRVMDFGAFVELEPGVEGLVHISELSHQRVRRPSDVVKPGQEVQVKVLKVEPGAKRMSLSLKAAQAGPEVAAPEEPEKPAKPLPPRRKPLKGGL